MELEEVVLKLVETIEKLSPVVWSILLKQAMMLGITRIVWALFFVFVTWRIRAYIKNADLDGDALLFTQITSYISGGVSVYFLLAGMMRMLNPGYYAIVELISQIR